MQTWKARWKKYYLECIAPWRPEWQTVRKCVWERDQGVCQMCHQPIVGNKWHCHHRSYDNLGEGNYLEVDDCVCLHPACHAKLHGKIDPSNPEWFDIN